MQTESTSPQPISTHIYEIDFIRAITVFSVVTIHAITAGEFLVTKPASAMWILNFVIHALHYNREMFMFVTGLVLTYAYFNKPFSAKKFWIKRAILVLIPYALWTVIYTKINNPSLGLIHFIAQSGLNILTGNASYQLYYILLAVEFYAIFPLFLMFLKAVKSHPWITLIISFFLQIIGMYLDFYFLQSRVLRIPYIFPTILYSQDRIFLTYQFFFILGAFGALSLEKVFLFFKQYGKYLPLLFLITLALFAFYFNVQINRQHLSYWHATSVLQPSVVIYSLVAVVFFSWVAYIWAKQKIAFRIVRAISDTSFGIYFVHVFFLTIIVKYFLPLTSPHFPVLWKIIFFILSTFTISVIFCYILLKIPFLSWTIGKATK